MNMVCRTDFRYDFFYGVELFRFGMSYKNFVIRQFPPTFLLDFPGPFRRFRRFQVEKQFPNFGLRRLRVRGRFRHEQRAKQEEDEYPDDRNGDEQFFQSEGVTVHDGETPASAPLG